MEHLFGSMSLAACMFDRNLTIGKASKAAATMFGLPTLLGRQADDLVPGAAPVLHRCFELADLGLPLPDHRFIMGGRDYAVTFHPLRHAGLAITALLAVAMDVTRSLRIERVLRASRRRLLMASRQDHLTGLLNRRGFDAALHREVRRARRSATPLSLLIIDIDWFKAYNDNLGHQEGDRCLGLVADALGTCLRRASDLACRYGGEEFVLILPETDAKGAVAVAANCQQAIHTLAIAHPASAYGRLTTSIGIVAAQALSIPVDPTGLFAQADTALYRAKNNGRNRWEINDCSAAERSLR
ncbi:GGDEF domain-containing protein [Novosphingobium sp. fls2-241-R2A-195]|uniref:GGDEF domain-containing protein n=1 Tax=Novosphingobium sp. fls2-241-R2A-195 TaxID=3040296 RepID=UPI00254C1F98|nr:GGDEF domain-containing protein [Novosphingobium sp. fls2-241-R2A-195]